MVGVPEVRHIACIVAAGMAAYGTGCASAWTPLALAQPAIAGDDAAQLLHRLADPQVPAAAREAAANRLITTDDRRTLALVEDAFRGDGPDRLAQRSALLTAAARAAEPTPALFPLIAAYLEAAPADQAPAAIESLGSFRTAASVELLLTRAAPNRPNAERLAAFRALARLTGRDDLGDSHVRWAAWYDRNRGQDEAHWQATIAAGLAARADRLNADRADAVFRLGDAIRRLYLALGQAPAPAEQPRLLAALLTDSREELRSLGFDILSRELASARPIDPVVEATIVGLLADPSPAVRSRAAMLIRQVSPAGTVEAVARALAVEENPEAAQALLLAAARWPSEPVRNPALRWLARGPQARSGAVQTLLALARSGLIHDPAHREAVAALLRSADPQALTPAECRLLAAVGSADDLERVAALIDGPPSPLRTVAAEALAEHPRYFGTLMAAADPDLFEAATRAVLSSRPDAEGFGWLKSLPAPSPEARTAALLRIAAALPTDELLAAAADAELPIREAMLARLAQFSIPGDATSASLTAGLLMLADSRLVLGNPDAALFALDWIPPGATESAQNTIDQTRTIALLWLGRIDEAEELNTPAAAWMLALEHCLLESHAAAVANAIGSRFKDRLTPAESGRLEDLRRRITPSTGVANGSEDPPRQSGPP
jgi:hypothetical protein